MEDTFGSVITIDISFKSLINHMPDWDHIFSKKGKVFHEPHPDMEKISKLFKEKGVKRVLDLGCGTGRHIIFLLKKGFEVYGMDASPKAINMAKEWLIEEDKNAELCLSRMEDGYPYEDNFFDAIISIQVIHHNRINDIISTVKEIERILKKEGLIFLTFPVLGTGSKLDSWELKEIEKGTYVPQKGQEKGLFHHFFAIDEIFQVFSSFNILEMYMDQTNHRAIIGIKK